MISAFLYIFGYLMIGMGVLVAVYCVAPNAPKDDNDSMIVMLWPAVLLLAISLLIGTMFVGALTTIPRWIARKIRS